MATATKKSEYRGKDKGLSSSVLWALAHFGDINENYKGGNALHTLCERMAPLNMKYDTVRRTVWNLVSQGKVERLSKNQRIYALRLKVPASTIRGTNPFAEVQAKALPATIVKHAAPLVTPTSIDVSHHVRPLLNLTLTERAQVVAELSASLADGIGSYRLAVVDGL